MYILTLTGKPEQVFSLANIAERQVVPMFEQEEDAERYVYLIDECTDPMAPLISNGRTLYPGVTNVNESLKNDPDLL